MELQEHIRIEGRLVQPCKYGENAWQTPAGLYSTGLDDPLALDKFELVDGDDASFNNDKDINRLLHTVTHLVAGWKANRIQSWPEVAVAVKHGNACGAGLGGSVNGEPPDHNQILTRMIAGDTRAILGGSVMTTFPITAELADTLINWNMTSGERRKLDCVVAPEFDEEAVIMLARKHGKCRILRNPALTDPSLDTEPLITPVRGGFLIQPNYTFVPDFKDNTLIECHGKPADWRAIDDLILAWAVGSTSNSNTITLAHERTLIGNGVCQQDRVGGCELAVKRARDAGHYTIGAVAYSDSFFPFADGVEVLAQAGLQVILSSSGSIHDQDVLAFCASRGITIYLVPDKKGRGFFGHF